MINIQHLLTLTYCAAGIWAIVGILYFIDWLDFVAISLGVCNFIFSWFIVIAWIIQMMWFVVK